MNLPVLIMAVVSKTDISRKIPNNFKFVKKMNLKSVPKSSSLAGPAVV